MKHAVGDLVVKRRPDSRERRRVLLVECEHEDHIEIQLYHQLAHRCLRFCQIYLTPVVMQWRLHEEPLAIPAFKAPIMLHKRDRSAQFWEVLLRIDKSYRRRREFPVITRYPQNSNFLLTNISLMLKHRTQLRNEVLASEKPFWRMSSNSTTFEVIVCSAWMPADRR